MKQSSPEKDFSLIVPAYNEEKRLSSSLPHIFDYLKGIFSQWEVLYVDDGSSDQTYQNLLEAANLYPEMRVLKHERNQGKGKAVRTGFEAAQGKIIVFSDADFSTPIEETQKLLDYLADGFDIVIGSRGVPGARVEIHQSLLRETTGKVGNAVVQALLLLPYQDTQCGFKMFRAEAIHKILPLLTIDGFAFDMEILAVAAAQGCRIAEVPVTWNNVLESKVRMLDTLQVFFDLLKIRYGLSVGNYS